MSKSKDQGTRWESACRTCISTELEVPVVRLAEEGRYDRGDLAFHVGGHEVIIECRDRETMQVHKALAKAKRKAGDAWTAVVWKRKKLQPGNQVRTQVGPPVAILLWDDLIEMLQVINRKEQQ